MGSGLPDLGITPGTVLDESQYPAARALMQGRHPHSLAQLVPVKQQVPDHAKARGLPLVIAIEQTARARGINVDDLWTSNRQRATWGRLRRQVRARPEQARIPADKAAVLLKRADLDPHDVYGPTFVEALSHADERVPVGNSGYDVTITFPKSFSALAALAPQPIADGIEDCLRQAALDALALLEHHTAYAIRGHHGDGQQARTVPTSGFAGGMTTHRASRAGDPHWHVHFTLANLARAQDDKWSTIAAGGRDLMNHVHLAGAYAEARARHLLTQRHGLRFTRSDRTGRWEITGVPDRLLALWSKRDTEIRDLLNHQGTTWDDATPTAKRRAADRTRESKDPHLTAAADADLHHAWTTQARTAGLDPAAILNAALNPTDTPRPGPPHPETASNEPEAAAPDLAALADVLLDPDHGLTSHSTAFRKRDMMARVCEELPHGLADLTELHTLTDRLLDHHDVTEMPRKGPAHMANNQRYTTQDVLDAEQAIVAATANGLNAGLAAVDPAVAALALDVYETSAGHPLGPEQRHAYTRLVTAGHAIDPVIGVPGPERPRSWPPPASPGKQPDSPSPAPPPPPWPPTTSAPKQASPNRPPSPTGSPSSNTATAWTASTSSSSTKPP